MAWCIYKHTNKTNGKVYIGQTCKKPEDRWGKDGNGYYNQGYFWNAIQKYGWHNFEHSILEKDIPTIELANEREKYYIKLFHSCVYDSQCNGYNLTFGGEGCTTWTEAEDEKLYQFYETKGPDIYLDFGGKYTREAVRTRANRLGIYCQFTPILRINDKLEIEKKYSKVSDVEEDGYSRTAVLQCAQRLMTRSGGKHWCFEEDYNENWKPWFGKFQRSCAVYCIELEMTFDTAKEASRVTGANYSHILHCCNKIPKYNTSGGYHWCWDRDKESFERKYDKDTSQCYCINDGKFYETLALAGQAYGCSSSNISAVCRGKLKTTKGLTFCYAKDYHQGVKPNKPKNKKVRCVETGMIYESAGVASQNTICSRTCIRTSCENGKPTKGLHWEYVEE